ncbi:energy-coupling factor transporter transmembrane component T family protein [Aeromicrobium sp. CTD01-1L150]|uniref:energy-coupling factor transporter transmembrane component T family protein n=1 Tax=Aeromicrobium sp. CTD01-1L150 TaxID=3341830 RepID=UPI0035BF4BD9
MSTPSLLGLYRPGTTWLHRLGAGPKFLGLVALSLMVVLVRGPWSGVAFLGLAVVLTVWSAARLRTVLLSLRGIAVVALMLGGYQAWQRGWPVAVEVVADLFALVLASLVLTATTPLDEMLETLTRALGPLRRLGVDPERVALAFSLMLRAVPETLTLGRETRDAAKARGLERSPRAALIPFAIRVVAQARETGEALDARGIAD